MEHIIKFNKVPRAYWSMQTRIEYLQRRIVVWSILYYEFDTSVVTDFDYTSVAFQLAEMQEKYKDDAVKSRYWYVFSDFDGSTGYYLYSRLNDDDKKHLMKIAYMVKQSYEQSKM